MSAAVPEPRRRRVLTEDRTYLDEDGRLVVRRVVVFADADTGELLDTVTIEARP